MTLLSLIRRRSVAVDPAHYEALTEACWYWEERAVDLAESDAEIPGLVGTHLADVAGFLRDFTTDADLERDGDPALVSAQQIAASISNDQWGVVADACDALAEELGANTNPED